MYLPNIQAILQEDVPSRKKDLAKLLLQNAIQGVLLNKDMGIDIPKF
jgi:hypothetical protein